MKDYDLIVIGGGSAGLTAVEIAIQFGLRTALIEKDQIGGDCTWSGCIPSKTLIKTARVAYQMRSANQFGLTNVEPAINFEKVMGHVKQVIQDIYQEESAQVLRGKGVDVFLGNAKFVDAHTIIINDKEYRSRKFLLATGARAVVPDIPGSSAFTIHTYETIWNLTSLPNHMIIIGAGPVGVELGQAFSRLGSKITILEKKSRILSREDEWAARLLEDILSNEGITLRLDCDVQQIHQEGSDYEVTFDGKTIIGDCVLAATGRKPSIDSLDLAKAGVTYGPQGIEVNRQLRTSRKNIYAAGDCLGGFQFTHYAGWQAAMAIRNAFLPGSQPGKLDTIARVTFTDPEIAQAGLTEKQAREKFNNDIEIYQYPMSKVDRAQTEAQKKGFLKIIYNNSGTILGVTIVSANAAEMINEWVLAMDKGIKISEISTAVHVYPTYSLSNMQASANIRINQILQGHLGKILKWLVRKS